MNNKYYNEIEQAKLFVYNDDLEYAIGIDFDSHEANILMLLERHLLF